jgi:DivIVA domain-containing protein
MDWNDIDRLRAPGFAVARRGYDQREVDKFLDQLADWLETDAADQVAELAVKRKLELVGKSTSNILLTTQQEAEQLLRQTQEQCAELRARTEQAAAAAKQAAEEHAAQVRAQAEDAGNQAIEVAEERARRMVEEGERRRAAVEAVVAELDARRDEALKELERLSGELGTTIERHRGAERPSKRNGGKARERAQGADRQPAV